MTAGMLARVIWALLSACGLGLWCRQRLRSQAPPAKPEPAEPGVSSSPGTTAAPDLPATFLRNTLLLLCALWSLLWLALALLRLRYPFELEWNGGAMRDHCLRLLAGLPLYTAPQPDWIPYFYPPFYYQLCASVMRLVGSNSFAVMRGVGIASTLGCVALLFLWVDRLSRHTLPSAALSPPAEKTSHTRPSHPHNRPCWGFVMAGLFLSAYRFTGAWYDIERLDMVFLFFTLLGIYTLELASLPHTGTPNETAGRPARGRQGFLAVLAAIALTLAFLTKQQALLFIFGGVAALAWRRAWQTLLLFATVTLALCGSAVYALNAASGGWFAYYCFQVPLGQGIETTLAIKFLLADLPLYAPILAILALPLLTRRASFSSVAQNDQMAPSPCEGEGWGRVSRSGGAAPGERALLVTMTATGVLVSFVSRAHWGGSENVLIPGYVLLGAAACVAAGYLERTWPSLRAPLCALFLAQIVTLAYRPGAQLPTAANRATGARFAVAIRALEREGEVLCWDHGSFTSVPHLHSLALMNLQLAHQPLPPAFLAGLHAHRFAAIVTDAKPEPGDPLLRDYVPTECLDFTQTWVVTGYETPDPIRRVWVLRPRP